MAAPLYNRLLAVIFSCILLCSPALAGVSKWVQFENVKGHIHLPITVNGIQGTAILDSGSEIHGINTQLVDTKNLGSGPSIRLIGAYGVDKQDRKTFNNVPISLFDTNISFDGIVGMELGTDALALIGQPFFDAFIVQIDYPNKRIRLIERESIKLRKEKNIKMRTVKQSAPIVQVEIEGKKLWLTLDTGNSSGILINRSVAKKNNWLEQFSTSTSTSSGIVTEANLQSIRVAEVKFGPFTVENALVSVPDEGNSLSHLFSGRSTKSTGSHIKQKTSKGLIGYDIVKHFVLTIDYKYGLMHVGLAED